MKPWLLALVAANRRLVTQTFTSNSTFTVPFGVSSLASLTGVGGSTTSQAIVSVAVSYSPSGTGVPGSGPADWSSFQSVHNSNVSTMNAGGSATISQSYVTVYPDGTTSAVTTIPTTITDAVAGTATSATSGGWSSSGAVTSSGEADIHYSQFGDDTTGFGKTFAGSTGSGAGSATYNNVAVTENTAYSLVIPTGGSITITYYR